MSCFLHKSTPAVRWLTVGLLVACSSPGTDNSRSNASSQTIVDGVPASPDDYPSTVALTDPLGDPFCSGTLVSPTVVVTAAHCLEHETPSGVRVVYGQTIPEDAPASERRTVAQVLPHPHYDPDAPTDAYGLGHSNDIGVLVLDEPIPNAVIAPVLPLSEVDAILYPSRPMHIVGYGINDVSTQASGELYKAITPHVRHVPTELLAGRPGQPDTCYGDSGGPAYIVDNDTLWLVGATSRAWLNASEACGESTIYTMVPYYAKWISMVGGDLDGGVVDGGFSGGGWDAATDADASLLDGNPACLPLDSQCHPLTNEGCDTAAGEACRFDPIAGTVGCFPGPNDALPGKMCDQTSRFCMPGFHCGKSIRCEKLCCSDADCPAGVSCTLMISLLGDIGTCGPIDIEPDAAPDADAASDATVEAAADVDAVDAAVDSPPDGPDSDAEPGPPEAIDPTGGCACTTSPRRRSQGAWALPLILAALALRRRQRG